MPMILWRIVSLLPLSFHNVISFVRYDKGISLAISSSILVVVHGFNVGATTKTGPSTMRSIHHTNSLTNHLWHFDWIATTRNQATTSFHANLDEGDEPLDGGRSCKGSTYDDYDADNDSIWDDDDHDTVLMFEDEVKQDDSNEEDESFVSDAEAILACRAHFQRKHLLGELGGWTAGAERKRQRALRRQRVQDQFSSSPPSSSNDNDDSDTASMGFFWDSVQELAYFNQKENEPYVLDEDATTKAPSLTSNESVAAAAPASSSMAQPATTTNVGTALWENSALDANANEIVSSVIDSVSERDSLWDEGEVVSEYIGSSQDSFQLYQKRSKTTRTLFADPEWKAAWYQRRWGGSPSTNNTNHTDVHTTATLHNQGNSSTSEQQQQRILEQQVRQYYAVPTTTTPMSAFIASSLPASSVPLQTSTRSSMDSFLSQYVSTLSEAEIATAIQTYRSAKRKRLETTQKNRQRQTQEIEQQRESLVNSESDSHPLEHQTESLLPRDLLLQTDVNVLKEQRQRRAEIARQIYQARRQRTDAAPHPEQLFLFNPPSPLRFKPASTPGEALLYIQINWLRQRRQTKTHNENDKADWSDLERHVQLMLQPTKLANRKETLRQILAQLFDLRGKCVPSAYGASIDEDYEEQLHFVTKASIEDLGAFVLDRIRAARRMQKR